MMMELFGQLNISKMSNHSELALSNFLDRHNVSLLAVQETGHWTPTLSLFDKYLICQNTTQPTSMLSGVALIIDKKFKPEIVDSLNSDKVDTVWCQIYLNGQRHLIRPLPYRERAC